MWPQEVSACIGLIYYSRSSATRLSTGPTAEGAPASHTDETLVSAVKQTKGRRL